MNDLQWNQNRAQGVNEAGTVVLPYRSWFRKAGRMLTRFFHQIQNDWQASINASIPVYPTEGAYEQTRKSWATQIRDYESIPECYRPYYEALRQSHQAMPYTIKTPGFEGFFAPTTEKLITLMEDSLLFLDRVDRKTSLQHLDLDQIGHIEYKSVLLYSRLYIYGLDDQQKPVRITCRFNSVTDYLFQPVVESFRLLGREKSDQPRPLEVFDYLQDLNFKFMNYARRSLLPGDTVIASLLQPTIEWNPFKIPTKIFSRQISPAHLAVLCDHELIWIQDEPRSWDNTHYGGIWHYIRLNKLANLTFVNQGLDAFRLRLEFIDGSKLDFVYKIDLLERAEEIAEAICKLQPGIELESLPR